MKGYILNQAVPAEEKMKLDANNAVPLYEQMKIQLQEQISVQVYAAGRIDPDKMRSLLDELLVA